MDRILVLVLFKLVMGQTSARKLNHMSTACLLRCL
jgi:hypothetical protein